MELLKSYGIDEVYEQIGRTGVVAMIHGGHSGPCVGKRIRIACDDACMVMPHSLSLTHSLTHIRIHEYL